MKRGALLSQVCDRNRGVIRQYIGSGPERQRSIASRPRDLKFLTFDDGGRCESDGEVSECAIEEEKQGDGCEAHRIHYKYIKAVNSNCGAVYDSVARNA